MGKDNSPFPSTIVGISPLGGNSSEDGEIQAVPLVYSEEVGAYISEQAQEEIEDREMTEIQREADEEEEEFRAKAGFRKQ